MEQDNVFHKFSLQEPPRLQIIQEPRNKLYNKIRKSVLIHNTF